MDDTVAAYVKGRQEGYFNVRLEYSILEKNQQSRALFAKGYQIGKAIRQQESIKESKTKNNDYATNRKAYITIMGYRAASQGETVNNSLLKDDDKTAFDNGYRIGLLYKNGKIEQITPEDLETYLMITGYEISEESYLVYMDMLKDYSGMVFDRGHNVSVICDRIQKSAIEELDENRVDIFKKR